MRFRGRLSKEELVRLYYDQKHSLEEIARTCGVSRVAIYKYCKALGIIARSKSKARLEAQRKGKLPQKYYDINEDFFSRWSSEMAYILGLIITDGCMSKVKGGSYKITLALNDKSLLEKVRNVMGSRHNIVEAKYQKGLYLFGFARERLAKDLLRLGVTPKKSLTVQFPDVPDGFLSDFVRGVFDGDGCVFLKRVRSKAYLNTSFVSGSYNFISVLEAKLQMSGLHKRNIYVYKGSKKTVLSS